VLTRKIVRIDEALCNGCGDCLTSCHEGALALVDGKARLVRDVYCDGLGACLGECPQGALTIEEREAEAFDEAEVEHRKHAMRARLRVVNAPESAGPVTSGCPGSALRSLPVVGPAPTAAPGPATPGGSQLRHWPVQLRLVPAGAPFMAGADGVVCADCVPFTVPDFHARYLTGRAVVVGCPKLDDLADMDARLAALVQRARPRRLTVVRMEVPCCRGIADAALRAAEASGLDFPVEEHVASVSGAISERKVR
jgi:Pyruvate/2-oxoacid:ferredoxin oxidoreductase delta subunit